MNQFGWWLVGLGGGEGRDRNAYLIECLHTGSIAIVSLGLKCVSDMGCACAHLARLANVLVTRVLFSGNVCSVLW